MLRGNKLVEGKVDIAYPLRQKVPKSEFWQERVAIVQQEQ